MPTDHAIQWLNMPGYRGETLNPIRARLGEKVGWHCEKCAAGCLNCYAEKMNLAGRFRGTGWDYSKGNRHLVEHILDRKTLEAPLHWRKPRMIFWQDMGDLFGDWVRDEWIDQVFAIAARTPQHVHCLLTKRPGRMIEYHNAKTQTRIYKACQQLAIPDWHWPAGNSWPFKNLWRGTSVSTQADADKNIPLLCKCPAAVRFVSFEPLLERVDVGRLVWFRNGFSPADFQEKALGRRRIDWGIFGGESGARARPCNVDDIRFGVEQFRAAGLPCFVKQDSGPRPGMQGRIPDDLWAVKEWPTPAQAGEE